MTPLETLFAEQVLPQIKRMAAGYARKSGLCADDLVQEASIEAWKAMSRYDESRGVPMDRFLAPRIHGAMQDYARNFGHCMGNVRNHLEKMPEINMLPRDKRDRLIEPEDHDVAEGWTIQEHLAGLQKRERGILAMYFVDDMPMREIGPHWHLKEAAVGNVIRCALKYLRVQMGVACSPS